MADETFDEDIFDDLYDEPEEPTKPTPAPAASAIPTDIEPAQKSETITESTSAAHNPVDGQAAQNEYAPADNDAQMGGSNFMGSANQSSGPEPAVDDNYGPINVKEDGKMFIGGLNWETTEQSLKDYFSQFGEVSECTVMRDSATGRSRGFGFLTFKDPKCVNIVMVKEHYLDGKIIDPKRAIPREEQERTSKIFVGGVSQEATEEDFKNFFKQFGRVVDATLMMDKDTGRPRGFGFVTFDGDAAVDACLQGPLQILGKPIEVKRAQPRGNMREEEDNKKFGRGGKFGGRDDRASNGGGAGDFNQANMGANGQNAGMTPAMMAQYWQRMQLYFRQMQQNLAAQNGGMPNAMGGMPGMNPQMMGMMANGGGPMGGMNPQMMNQMGMMGGNMSPGQNMGNQPTNFGNNQGMMGGEQRQGGPGYTAQEQLMFEQQKYQQQEARRMQQQAGFGGQGGPTSWEGMYDDIPQPGVPSGPGAQRMHGGNFKNPRGRQGSSQPPSGPSNAPANAPTGPKNAGKPGANYRGGGRNANYRHNPYGGGRG